MTSVLERTPFQFKEIKTRESLAALRAQIGTKAETPPSPPPLIVTEPKIQLTSFEDVQTTAKDVPAEDNLYELARTLQVSLDSERDLILLGGGGMSTSNSQDLLSTSPIFGYVLEDNPNSISSPSPDNDNYGLDLSLTEGFRHGISNINYDFDVSDHSAENSVAEGGPVAIAPPTDLFANKTLIEDSPKDVLLPSPLQPTSLLDAGKQSDPAVK